jgi:putative ABC transport system permease protein
MTSRGLVWKNLFRKKLRTFLTIFAIIVAFAIYGVLMAFQVSLDGPTGGPTTRRLATTNSINFTESLPIAYVNKVRAMPEVKRATHANWFGGYYQERRNFLVTFAVDPETYLDIYEEYVVSPEARAAFLKDRQALLIGKPVADRYGWKAGDRVPLRSDIFFKPDGSDTWEFNVAGVFTTTDVPGGDDQVLFNYDYFNEGKSFSKDQIGQIIIEPVDPKQMDALAQKVDALFANSRAETETRSEAAFGASFAGQFGNIGFILTAVVGAAFITILLIAGNTMMLTVRERTGEIAVLKTIGFTARRIFAMVMSESMLLALIGGLIGLVIAWFGTNAMASAGGFLASMVLTPGIALGAFGLMVLLGLVTGALPAWNAMKTDIITAFGRK